MGRITFKDKISLVTNDLPANGKLTAAEANAIKNSVNDLYDLAINKVVKSEDQLLTINNFADIADLSFPMEANGVYHIKGWLRVISTQGRTYTGCLGPASQVQVIFKTWWGTANNLFTATDYDFINGFQPGDQFYEIFVMNGPNAGTFSMRAGRQAGDDYIKAGSTMEWRKIN